LLSKAFFFAWRKCGVTRSKSLVYRLGLLVQTEWSKTVPKYDVAISFAGEDRPVAKQLAASLVLTGLNVFYDEYEQADLWGKDLYTHLSKVYKDESKYCLMLISEHYAKKQWTNHERKAAQARAFAESSEYILPLRLDDSEIEGVLGTTGYLDIRQFPVEKIVESLAIKVRDYNKAHGIVFETVRVQDVFRKEKIQVRDDGDFRTTCPACHSEQTLDEAKILQEDAETVYTCKNGCQRLVVVSPRGKTKWPVMPDRPAWKEDGAGPGLGFVGYGVGDYFIRNVGDLLFKTDLMARAVLLPASPAALMKK